MPKTKKNARFRNFVFTWNNYEEDTVEKILGRLPIKYMVVGKEVGDETQTPHLQGYVELQGQKSFRQLRKALENNHFEKRQGTAKEAADYCKKDGDFEEFGQISNAGARNDLIALRDILLTGIEDRKLVEIDEVQQCIARHPRYVQFVRRARVPRRTVATELHIFWGPTGTGKSHQVREMSPCAYWKDITSPTYWCGYNGTDDVILDDFGGEISLRMMLRLCDKTPLQVQVKGSYIDFAAKRLFITSNMHPDQWWNRDANGYDANFAAFVDRITSITELTGESKRR